MKKRPDVDELARQLTASATTPLQSIAPIEPPQAVETRPATRKKQKSDAIPVFLRLPATMYQHLENIAVTRTKETGRGISVQQVIIEQLERGQ